MINDVVSNAAQGPVFYLPFVLRPSTVLHKSRSAGRVDCTKHALRATVPVDVGVSEAKHDSASSARRARHLPFSCLQRLVCPVSPSRNIYSVITRQTLLQ